MTRKSYILGIDFDGTCVKHDYPNIGDDIGAAPVLRKLIEAGHRLILWTMRSDFGVNKGLFKSGLNDAVKWFIENDIPLYGIQRNPEQDEWTDSPKAYCHLFIDDTAIGCPVIEVEGERPYVDWVKVEQILKEKGLI